VAGLPVFSSHARLLVRLDGPEEYSGSASPTQVGLSPESSNVREIAGSREASRGCPFRSHVDGSVIRSLFDEDHFIARLPLFEAEANAQREVVPIRSGKALIMGAESGGRAL